jgi:hypothetical protein
MPRYFFHLHWEAARTTARELMQTEAAADVHWLSCHFEVTDEAGEIVFELPFAEVVEIQGEPN